MFQKAFIIEDTPTDINDIKGFLCLKMSKNDIITITNIEDALSTILNEYKSNGKFVAFIDIIWHGQDMGTQIAKTIRNKAPNVKLVAFTTIGQKGDLESISKNFDAAIDKNTNSPNVYCGTLSDIGEKFLEKLSEGFDFFAGAASTNIEQSDALISLDSYFFTIKTEKKTSFQFIVTDYCKFSSLEADIQLSRFRSLQDSIRNVFLNDRFRGKDMVLLPTGDGVVIGIKSEAEPLGLEIAFELLENLRDHALEKEIRIGVHFGVVYLVIGEKDESQLIGPGINKAARIEAACEPGKILISEEYYSHFVDRSGDSFCRSLKINDTKEFKVKEEKFEARFVSKGKIAS